MNQNENFLVEEKIGRLMRKYALPCVISLLVAALYNIVDQIFIANADYLGSNGNAANNAVFPMTVIALAVAVMIGDGCCAFVSISLGKGEKKHASKSIGNAVLLSVISGIVIAVIYLLFPDFFVTAFGGNVNEETYSFAKEYFFWISLGVPLYVFGQAANPIIRADGSPKFAMISTVSGAVVNIILDPVFIFVFRWGMAGAAIATVAGQLLNAILAAIYLCNTKKISLTKDSFIPDGKVVGKTLSLGACSFLAQISLVAAMAAINNSVKTYGMKDPVFSLAEYAQIPMAVVGIVMKFFQIVISAVIGLAAGCIPVVGFNIGAGRRDRVKGLLTRLLIAEMVIGVIALIAAEVFPNALIGIFGASAESVYYTEFAVKSFRIYLCTVVLACINKATFIFLQAMGKAGLSTFLSTVREIVFGVGFAILLPLFMGLDGVLWSMPASDILTFIISAIILAKTYKTLSE